MQFIFSLSILTNVFALVVYSLKPNLFSKIVLLFSFSFLTLIQITSSRLATSFEFSGYEKYLIERRFTTTPSFLKYIDPPQFYRYRQNLFSSINFIRLTQGFPTILTPLFLLGVIVYIKYPIPLISKLFLTGLLINTVFGPESRYGPIILVPFIYFLTAYVLRMVKK